MSLYSELQLKSDEYDRIYNPVTNLRHCYQLNLHSTENIQNWSRADGDLSHYKERD